jgi:hypothetical protein
MAALLLVVGCVNVTGLMLVRGIDGSVGLAGVRPDPRPASSG